MPVCAAIVAGMLNSAAGGGSFVSFPAMLVAGYPPVLANATNTMAMRLGNLGSIGGFREDVALRERELAESAIVSVIGSICGALVLLRTPEHAFVRAVPYLLGFATLLFAAAPMLQRIRTGRVPYARTINAVTLFVASVYGGYFGAGVGIVIIALFSLTTTLGFARINARKNVLAFFINGAAVVPFAIARSIDWHVGLFMAAGAVAGAYVGARVIRRLPQAVARGLVVTIGTVMTVYFFVRG